ncbi:MAG: DUF4886 domain-containing protein [Chitinophagaceae bacterium]|nr:DUF4886 domain-containing protein [Chitinophagaceae bacterium]
MRKFNTTALLILLTTFSVFAEKRRILFIGNSYTGVNDLPNTVKNLALSFGDTLEIDSNTPGGYTFNMQSTDATTLSKIKAGNWDYVVLQAQSQEPAFSPAQVESDTYPYAKKLCDSIRAYNNCAEILFYMTWGRKNGDASNCAAYPPICTYAGMQQRLRESYLEMADSNNATCVPAGVAWKNLRAAFPLIELYQTDESHPSANGTYLVACTFYSSIYHKPSDNAGYVLSGVSAADALNLQSIASHTVLDSLENWQQSGSIPYSDFSFVQNANQVTFTNTAKRSTQYEWNFGDGSALNTTTNPAHTYLSAGQYFVTLKAYTSCKSSSHKDTVDITNIPNGLNETNVSGIKAYLQDQTFIVNHAQSGDQLDIISLAGQRVYHTRLTQGQNQYNLTLLPGSYIYRITRDQRRVSSGNIIMK